MRGVDGKVSYPGYRSEWFAARNLAVRYDRGSAGNSGFGAPLKLGGKE